jgi:hypothetical protein
MLELAVQAGLSACPPPPPPSYESCNDVLASCRVGRGGGANTAY